MAAPETNTRKIIARLKREGWVNVGGAKHDKFRHPNFREPIQVPRHRTVTPKVARKHRAGRRMDQMKDGIVSTYIALVDGKPGAFGVVFPDCPGCTAMGRTVEEVVANAAEALADWAEDVDPMPKPRTVAQLRRDPDVRQALADGDVLVFVPLVRQSPPELRRYA